MTDRPIIFSGPMVRALRDDRKTQTRRLATSPLRRCAPGDRLYVREAWSIEATGGGSVAGIGEWGYELEYRADGATRELSYAGHYEDDPYLRFYDTQRGDWRPSIHMPRWASRLTLIVEEVRFEQIQAISEADAIAEGIEQFGRHGGEPLWKNYSDGPTAAFVCPIKSYRLLWNSLHAKPEERWEDNPEIVALTFRVIPINIDRIEA